LSLKFRFPWSHDFWRFFLPQYFNKIKQAFKKEVLGHSKENTIKQPGYTEYTGCGGVNTIYVSGHSSELTRIFRFVAKVGVTTHDVAAFKRLCSHVFLARLDGFLAHVN